MIEHRPTGLGNPYRIEPDQRFPVLVGSGRDCIVRFTTEPDIQAARVEVQQTTGTHVIGAECIGLATPIDRTDVPQPAPRVEVPIEGEGHLAEAAARAGTRLDRVSWTAPIRNVGPGCEYRIVAGDDATAWFSIPVVSVVPSPAHRLEVEGAAVRPFDVTDLVDVDGIVHEVSFSLPCAPDDHIVGFGERFDGLDQRGARIDTRVYEQYKGQGQRTYLPVPFAHVVGSDWAFWIDGGASVRYDLAVTQADRMRITVEVPAGTDPRVRVVIVEGSPEARVRRFIEAHGASTLPPEWVFSLWLSANEWNTQQRVEAEVTRAQQEGIEAGVVVIEAWSDESTFTVFRDSEYTPVQGDDRLRLADLTFPADGAWPNPKGMVDRLHDAGMRVLLWQIPALKERGLDGSQTQLDWDEAINRSFVVRDETGAPYRNRGFWFQDALLPDFTDPRVRRWWTERRRYLVEDIGIDGFKTDGGEHPWGAGLQFADGTTGAESNNRYPVLYAQAYHELLQRLDRPAVTFSRAGFTGSSAFPCFWAGDEDSTWDAYRASITAGLTAASSGIAFWGFDIGGFSGPIPTAELYLRASAVATFCPIMQVHSEYNHHRTPTADRTPWNIAERTGDGRVLPVFRNFARIRGRLRPYLVQEARSFLATGRPLMAPLFFDGHDDPAIWEARYQYMLGRDLLVCPVTDEGATSATVYLPEGRWWDAWTGERFDGGAWHTVDAPVERIPLFVRGEAQRWRELLGE